MRDNADRDHLFPAIVLMVERQGQPLLLPDNEFALEPGDAILVAGQSHVRSALNLTVQNANAMRYVVTGKDHRGGWLWRWLFSKHASSTTSDDI